MILESVYYIFRNSFTQETTNIRIYIFLIIIIALITILTVKTYTDKRGLQIVSSKTNFISDISLNQNDTTDSISMEGRSHIQIVGKCSTQLAKIGLAYGDGSGEFFTDGVEALVYDNGNNIFSFSLTSLDIGSENVKIMAFNNVTGLSLSYHLFN